MTYLIDTNVISELTRKRPSERVVKWLDGMPPDRLYVSVLTLGELRKGVAALPAGARRDRMGAWLDADLPAWFEDRVFPIDGDVADVWGRMLAQIGRPVGAVDSLIAATAMRHGLRVVTRNTADFQFPGLAVENPWKS